MATRIRGNERVDLVCECGVTFEMTSRANRDRLRDGRKPVCRDCRFHPFPVVTDSLVGWWATLMTPEEALPLAELIWGPRDCWVPGEISIRRVVEEAASEGFTEEDFREIMSA